MAPGHGRQRRRRRFAHYLRNPSGSWHQLTRFEDGVKVIKFGKDAALYLLSKKNAPRGKILRLPLADPDLAKATVVVPEGRGVVDDYEPSASGLYVALMEGGPSRLWFYPRRPASRVEVPILPVSTAVGLHCWHGDELLFENDQFPCSARMV